jgi:hypothetical protein
MTRTGPGDVAMPACGRTPPRQPALTRFSSRELVPARPAVGVAAIARAMFPSDESFKPASARPGRLRLAGPLRWRRCLGAPRPACSLPPPDPLYLYLLKRPAAALPGCPFDPGRDMLCILISPPRWLQWP